MKVVVSCDELLKRDHLTEVVEAVLELYDEAEIYTLVHRPKAILGPIELRKIHSTFLSHKVKSSADLHNFSYLIPSAAKNLFIPCSVDLVINISSGLSQGIKTCEKTKVVTYLYNDAFLNSPKSWLEKIFSSYLKSYFKKSLKNVDVLYVSNDSLLEKVSRFRADATVLEPPFKINDWQIIPSPVFTYDHFCINANGLDVAMAKKLKDYLVSESIKFKFFGDDEHLAQIKNGPEDIHFFGDRCSGELAPLLSGSAAIIDLSDGFFPEASLKGLGTGRPVIALDSASNRSYLSGEGVFFTTKDESKIFSLIKDLLKDPKRFDSKKLRAVAVNYHEIKFKAELKRRLDRIVGESTPRAHHEKENCC
ncbi:hypothetical protein M899_0459 [Bacteriovorax sp. BSW11_IV]|uniref:hypothetical protein n=1 Tax=Bacteriovorax sp. BSW11_IV TaxID=1353529 RepID=UPI00038A5317|nr:hypothetical protein [Bacteriovorax sp. BSW11_IV]EQC45068.1 hypothetical protein M899_0459 [Bacteriovorax sp. BSW11_IV]